MDFFAQQARVRRSSRRLVVLFVLAVIAVVVSVDLVLVVALGAGGGAEALQQVRPGTLLGASIAVVVLIGLASLYRVTSLRGGGGTVARGLGATPVPADTTDPVWRRLRNVIEEVAIASGVPVPEIYVLEQEEGINAFAAGYGPSDAAVCVTQGCLDKLSRDELQGVIAHEFSHVLNGDMRLNIRLMGLLFGILVVGIVGRYLLYAGGRVRNRRGNTTSIAMIGVALLVVGYVGFFFGRLIQAAVARSRESLADASAVQFTRQTSGIAGALKKIAALAAGSRIETAETQEVAHMLFGEPGRFSRLFATHPPLPERIRALGVPFDEDEIARLGQAWARPVRAADADALGVSLSGFAPADTVAVAAAPAMPVPSARVAVDAGAVSARVGRAGHRDVSVAGSLRLNLPDTLARRARDPQQAVVLMLALAMSPNEVLRDAQLLCIDSSMGSADAEAAETLLPALVTLHPMLRLPLAALAFPVLKRRPRPELERLLATMRRLVRVDGRVDLHEFCLVRWFEVQLLDALDPAHGFVPGARRLRACRDSLAALCAIVADLGHDDDEQARRAWLEAMREALPNDTGSYAPPADWQPAFDAAVVELDRVHPAGKELVVRALVRAIASDGHVNVAESELLRLVCAALHCPLPPLLQADVPEPLPDGGETAEGTGAR